MKKSKKFVLAVLALLAITMVLLPLSGCKNDTVPEPTRYTVKFETAHGTAPADITVESRTKLTAEQLKGLADTADYIFEYWYDKADGTQEQVKEGYTVTKDVTLVAKWKPRDQVQISFKVSGNTVELSSEPAEATIHYTTDGTKPKESWDEYANPIEISSKITIKAYAEKLGELKESEVAEKTYLVVTFKANGGSEVAPQVVESAQPATKPTDPTNGDKVLTGWYGDSGLTKKFDFSTPVTADTTLYAYWQVVPVTFTLAGDIVTLSTTEGAAIHYTTDGTDPKTSETRQEGNSVSITQQTTVKAYATKGGLKDSDVAARTYCFVTFNANGGSEVAPQVVESGQTATRPELDPTKANWVFAGWYTLKDDGETLADTAYSFDTPVEGDITLYAAWNDVGDDGTIMLRNKVMSKTSEVPVLSEEVYLKDLYNADSNSQIFVDKREGSIQPFVMGQYEVTQQLYETVMGSNPSSFTSDVAAEETQGLRPVENVSWYDAVVFCNELTKKVLGEDACVYYSDAGLKTVYTTGDGASEKTPYMDTSKSGYRLPTEAEWELAARGGDPGADAWKDTYAGSSSIDDVAWYSSNSGNETQKVGTKADNSLELYDMSGNVWEWCWDRWASSITEATPSGGAASGSFRVCRGGSWYNKAIDCALSSRQGDYPDNPGSRHDVLGFRLVRSAN